MVFKNLCVLVFWTNAALALEEFHLKLSEAERFYRSKRGFFAFERFVKIEKEKEEEEAL